MTIDMNFDPHSVWSWIELGRYIVTTALAIVSICLAIKKRKIKFSELLNNLLSWIEEAETHDTWTGAEKRSWVMDRAFKYCVDNHIAYKEDNIADELERVLALSKSVNNAYHVPQPKKLNPAITGETIKEQEEH